MKTISQLIETHLSGIQTKQQEILNQAIKTKETPITTQPSRKDLLEPSRAKGASQTYSRDPKESLAIASLVKYCFSTLKRYGQTVDDLPMIIGAFDHVLKKYDIEKIKEAFNEHLSRKTNMPTPADIVNLIDPPKEWCVEKFKVIKEKIMSDTTYVTTTEMKYYTGFLNRELRGHEK